MTEKFHMSADKALERLINGNKKYVETGLSNGDVSSSVRLKTSGHGQEPFAVVVTCSDARVIPETIFSAGIGELFVIRVAGNVIDDHQLGSIETVEESLEIIKEEHEHSLKVVGAVYHIDTGVVDFLN